MNLLSDKDFLVLRKAMLQLEEITIERTLGDVSVSAKTCRVTDPWPDPMIVQVRMAQGNYSWLQNFQHVDEAREQLDAWDRRFHWLQPQ